MAQLPIQDPIQYYQVQPLEELPVFTDEVPKKLLTILLGRPYKHLASLWLFDAGNMVLHKPKGLLENDALFSVKTGRYVFKLPVGNYKVRLFVDGQFTDNLITLDKDKTCSVGQPDFYKPVIDQELLPPPLYSAVPLAGKVPYASTFDYYREAAVRISTDCTFRPKASESLHSGLFIFLRFASAETFQKKFKSRAYWKQFALYDSNDKLLVRFPDGTLTNRDLQPSWERKHGYLGFSAKLKPGLYFLKYGGKDKRTIPIYVYHQWYSQVFMTLDREPLFGSLKILIDRQLKFDPFESLHTYVDICLSKLQNEDYTLDRELLEIISSGKFESPMLGLLGAFIYLKGADTKRDELFRIIVRNMQHRILADSSNSPDIYALNFLSYAHFGTTIGTEVKVNVTGTPMLRVAYDTLRQAATRYEWVILPGSLNDGIAECQYFDSPFNTFKSLPLPKASVAEAPGDFFVEHARISQPMFPGNFWKDRAADLLGANLLEKLENPESDDPSLIDRESIIDFPVGAGPDKMMLPDFNWQAREDFMRYTTPDKLEKLLLKPKRIGRVAVQTINLVLQDPAIASAEIARRLSVPIATIERLRAQYHIYLRN